MSICLFTNNATTILAASLTSGATTCTLAPGTGALFPSPAAGQFFALTFNDVLTGTVYEIVYVTARSVDTLTIQRGQEGTPAVAWLAGDEAANLLTAGTMNDFGQLSGSDYAVDTGVTNALVIALNPPRAVYTKGFQVQFKAAHANTGGCTLDAGAGPVALLRNDGNPLLGNDIQAGTVFMAILVADGGPFWMEEYVTSQIHVMQAVGPWIYIASPTVIVPGGYLPDTRAGSFVLTLEATPSQGDNFSFNDQLGCFGKNPIIIDPNGASIAGIAAQWTCNIPGSIFTLVYDAGNYMVNIDA